MSIFSYWFGNFLFDFLFYFLVAIFGAGMCQAFQISSLTNGDALTATWLLFILYGFTNIPFTYVFSFVFKDYGNAQAGWYFFNFVFGGITSTMILILRFISADTRPVGRGLGWLLRLVPAFSFGEGLIN
jgi:ATP-binding cassette subfamily A (ABC1) protein 3